MQPASTSNKGKRRASTRVDERAPLLPAGGSHTPIDDNPDAEPRATLPATHPRARSARSRLPSLCVSLALALLSLLLAAALFLALLAASFKPSDAEVETLQRTALRYSTTPESVQVLNVTEAGVLLNLTVRCGVDADRALGVGLSPLEVEHAAHKGFRGAGAAWWEDIRLRVGRIVVRQIPHVEVAPARILISPRDGSPLVEARVSTMHVPLLPGDVALLPMALQVLAKPIAATGEIWEFIQHGWAAGRVDVVVHVEHVAARVPAHIAGGWAKYAQMAQDNVVLDVSAPIPHFPGLPIPGRPFDMKQIVKLEEYELYSKHGALNIAARASAPNPYPINATMPIALPFAVSIPNPHSETAPRPNGNADDLLRMAEVLTEPIDLSTHPLELRMAGKVVAALDDSTSLSLFLQNYLHGRDNPIVVEGMSTTTPSLAAPSWLLSFLSTISVPLMFPGPHPPPQVIRSVTIERMRISEAAGKMRASGLVVAQIDLPGGMEHVQVDVKGVLPDVYVYDGPVSDDRAFGHIRPDEFVNATTSTGDDPFNPHRLIVRAPIDNVPVDILPGRDRILSDFVGKVVWKGGALAGILGNASVMAEIVGVGGSVRLDDLPVRGETWVGRK